VIALGLLRDFFIKDIRKKRRIGIIIHLVILAIIVLSAFSPILVNIAEEEGYDFGEKTCILSIETFNETYGNGTEEFDEIEKNTFLG